MKRILFALSILSMALFLSACGVVDEPRRTGLPRCGGIRPRLSF